MTTLSLESLVTEAHWNQALDVASLIHHMLVRRQDGIRPAEWDVARLRELMAQTGREFLALAEGTAEKAA